MTYIEQNHDWIDGEQVTVSRLNKNVSTITDGLSEGLKDINVETVSINGTPKINSSGVFTTDVIGDVTGHVSDLSNHSITDLTNDPSALVTDAGSGIIISASERTNFTSAYTDTQAATDTDTANTIAKRALDPYNGYGLIESSYINSNSSIIAYAHIELSIDDPKVEWYAYNIPLTTADPDAVVWDGVNKWWKVKTELPGGANFDTDDFTVVLSLGNVYSPGPGQALKILPFSNLSSADTYLYIKAISGSTVPAGTGSFYYIDFPTANDPSDAKAGNVFISIYEN